MPKFIKINEHTWVNADRVVRIVSHDGSNTIVVMTDRSVIESTSSAEHIAYLLGTLR